MTGPKGGGRGSNQYVVQPPPQPHPYSVLADLAKLAGEPEPEPELSGRPVPVLLVLVAVVAVGLALLVVMGLI